MNTLYVVTVSNDVTFRATVSTALVGLAVGKRVVDARHRADAAPTRNWPQLWRTLTARANAFLGETLPEATVRLIDVERVEHLERDLRDHLQSRPRDGRSEPQPWTSRPTVLLLVDAASSAVGADVDARLNATIDAVSRVQQAYGFGVSPYSVHVYDELDEENVYSRTWCSTRQLPERPRVLAVEALCAFTDLIQARYANTRAMLPATEAPATLATALTDFLTEQSGTAWGLHFFTGSIVSKLIQDAATLARAAGNPVLRGPNEHSLACGALARWQLRTASFLIIVTSGMADELKGTLANLRDSQARGFIVIGENEPGTWQPFQGTMHDHENSRAVFEAYGLPCFYLTDPDRLGEDLAAAFSAYHCRRGPVVLLATPAVLRYTGDVPQPRVKVVEAHTRADEDTIDAIAHIVNQEPSAIVWQCGKLDEPERVRVYELARRAGIALVDSLGRPGTVARFHNGDVVDEYLGTMSLYGCSPAVWSYLHPSGQLLPYDKHALFFLKSRIQDLATPFAEKVLREKARIVQVTDAAVHVAPFTDIPVVEQLRSFLERLEARLRPEVWVVERRRRAIERARHASRDPLATVPSVPMSHEYFFTQLNDVLTSLVVDHGYTYTGFYDVGRGGVSAVRNLVRTGPGFSGWYGRALMGDALQAVPAFALSDTSNVLAFIGDGAANLVPSVVPSLAQQLRYESGQLRGNVSIFYLLNGGFSIIRSYRELQHAATADAQMSLLTPVAPQWQRTFGDVTITHERMSTVDPAHLAKRLLEPATVNLFSVYLAHDNEGDDIMPLSRRNWRVRPNEVGAASGRGVAGA